MTQWTASIDVGAQFSSTAGRAVTEEEIAAFADLTGDRHPIHVDPRFAAETPFGEPVAHGLLVMSLAVGMLPPEVTHRFIMRRVRDVVFRAPVKVGEEIYVDAKVASARTLSPEVELFELKLRVRGADGKAVLTGNLEAMLAPWEAD
jgi:3-hydroxybutyryl-CoA dehydratase